MIPESRKDEGLMLGRPVRENVSLPSLPILNRLGFMRRGAEDRRVRDGLARVAARAPWMRLRGRCPAATSRSSSSLGPLLVRPAVLIADEPTRGVDIGAKREIYEHLVALAATGVAILLISSEIEELLGLAHRVLVMRAGRIVSELEGDAITEGAILAAAFGAEAVAA